MQDEKGQQADCGCESDLLEVDVVEAVKPTAESIGKLVVRKLLRELLGGGWGRSWNPLAFLTWASGWRNDVPRFLCTVPVVALVEIVMIMAILMRKGIACSVALAWQSWMKRN